MVFKQTVYSVLVVSASAGFSASLKDLLPVTDYWPVSVEGSVAAARRRLLERDYDLVLINAPLPDDFGIKLAIDVCDSTDAAVAIFVKNELYDEVIGRVTGRGVLTVARPTTRQTISQHLLAMQAVRERMRTQAERITSLEDRVGQMRIVNRAKWLLIEAQGMTEEAAHHCIEKRAMDERISKGEAAQRIIREYTGSEKGAEG